MIDPSSATTPQLEEARRRLVQIIEEKDLDGALDVVRLALRDLDEYLVQRKSIS